MNLTAKLLQLPTNSATIETHILTPYEVLFYFFCIMITSWALHELGHYIALRPKNKDAKIEFFIKKGFHLRTGEIDMGKITKSQYRIILLSGIVVGTLPIIFASFIHNIYLLLLAGYFTGCIDDITQLFKK